MYILEARSRKYSRPASKWMANHPSNPSMMLSTQRCTPVLSFQRKRIPPSPLCRLLQPIFVLQMCIMLTCPRKTKSMGGVISWK